MKLIKTLKILLGIQLLVYVWALQIFYSSSHDGVDSFAGIEAIPLLGFFGLLGIVNLILIIVYFVKLANKKLPLDMTVIIFALINIVLFLTYNLLAAWALSGPD